MSSVSICIPTYNRPARLRAAVASALLQPDVSEVLVGDDGGFAADALADVDDARVEVRRHETRQGMSGNWQYLLDHSQGDVVGLLMDDDKYLPTFVSSALAVFESHPGVDVVFSNIRFIGPDRSWARQVALPPGRVAKSEYVFMKDRAVCISAALMRRSVWQAVRPLPDTAAADMVLFGRAAAMGFNFYYLSESLVEYGVHADQYSGRADFRHDTIKAWADLRFRDPKAEVLRRRVLARALMSRLAHLPLDKEQVLRDARAALKADIRVLLPMAIVISLSTRQSPQRGMALLLAIHRRVKAPCPPFGRRKREEVQ